MQIEPSASKHGITEEDVRHAYRHHWRAFETGDDSVRMFIGPGHNGNPIEVGVVLDEDGDAIIHAMSARRKFLKGWWTR